MAAKGWWIGCGALVFVGVVVLAFGVGYFANRARDFTRGLEHAKDRYSELNRQFPFTPPASGELDRERFIRYLETRSAAQSALSPTKNDRGILGGLALLSSLPEEVSRAHAEALRERSFSLDEYRWISRQLYSAVAAETHRGDADAALRTLKREIEAVLRHQGGMGMGMGGSSAGSVLDAGFIDLAWLRVPEATRAIVREHVSEIQKTVDVALADALLLNVGIEGRRRSEDPR